MTINNVNTNQITITSSIQAQNTQKLSTGFKVNRDDTAATLSINSSSRADSVAENAAASMSNITDIDKVDEMIANAQKNILSQPQDAINAQANIVTNTVLTLVQ